MRLGFCKRFEGSSNEQKIGPAHQNDTIDQNLQMKNPISNLLCEDEHDLSLFGTNIELIFCDLVLDDSDLMDLGDTSHLQKSLPKQHMLDFKSSINIPVFTAEELEDMSDLE